MGYFWRSRTEKSALINKFFDVMRDARRVMMLVSCERFLPYSSSIDRWFFRKLHRNLATYRAENRVFCESFNANQPSVPVIVSRRLISITRTKLLHWCCADSLVGFGSGQSFTPITFIIPRLHPFRKYKSQFIDERKCSRFTQYIGWYSKIFQYTYIVAN